MYCVCLGSEICGVYIGHRKGAGGRGGEGTDALLHCSLKTVILTGHAIGDATVEALLRKMFSCDPLFGPQTNVTSRL